MKIQSSTILRVRHLRCLGGSLKLVLRPFCWASNPEKHGFRSVTPKPCRNYHAERRHTGSSPRCWSLLSSSSLAISSRLNSWKRPGGKLDGNRTPLFVILVTPAHLSLLEDGNAFIPDLLHQEAELSQPGQVIDVMAAVVDRIPCLHAPTEEDGSRTGASLSGSSAGTTTRDGSEGVSVAVLDSDSVAPGLWATQQDLRERETMTIQQRCTLTFSIPSSTRANIEVQKLAGQDHASRMLQLPVANTVFQNGRTATLFAQRWILQQGQQSNTLLVPGQRVWLPQQELDLNGLAKGTSVAHSLHSDLIPITPPRAIKAAIGNIIRRVSASGSPEENTPASNELERAIIKGIKDGSIPDQPAEVWALVKPRGYAPYIGCETMKASLELDGLHRALLFGCRLHKVLSGGGGWGEKQGLLALDPDSNYSPRQQAFQSSTGDGQDTAIEKLQALGEVVKPGDIVTFYVRHPSLAQTNTLDLGPDSGAHSSLAPLYLTFGSLPSNMDVMPDILPTKITSEETDCVILDGCFGMLSEQGMSLTSTFSSSDIYNVTTKLDAPYTIFTVRAGPMAACSEGVSHINVRNHNQECENATSSKFNATSATSGRMSPAKGESATVSFWHRTRQRLDGFSLGIRRNGAILVRPFATDSRFCSQAEHEGTQEALFKAEAEAEIASLERQLRDRQTSAVAADGKPQPKPGGEDQELLGVRKYFRQVETESLIRRNISDPSPRQSSIRKHKSDLGPRPKEYRQVNQQSLIRKHISMTGPFGRYVKDEQRLPFPVDMLDRKMNARSPGNNASGSQLNVSKYYNSEAENETRRTREPRRVATNRNSPIRFISDRRTDDAHIEVPSKLGSESSAMKIEQNAEPIEIRRHLYSGQGHMRPSTVLGIQRVPSIVVPIKRVPGLFISKHYVAEKEVTTPGSNLVDRTHSVDREFREPASDLPHPTAIKRDSPRYQARELHSRYNLRSLREISHENDSRTS